MKKALLLLIVVLSWGSVFSQNGWNAYIKNNVSSFLAGTETALAIDKYGNKYSIPNDEYKLLDGLFVFSLFNVRKTAPIYLRRPRFHHEILVFQ